VNNSDNVVLVDIYMHSIPRMNHKRLNIKSYQKIYVTGPHVKLLTPPKRYTYSKCKHRIKIN